MLDSKFAPPRARTFSVLLALWVVSVGGTAYGQIPDSVSLPAAKDNTLYEDQFGSVSNGSGDNIFSGRVGTTGLGKLRRGLIAFDVSGALPGGATLTGVVLKLNMNGTTAGLQNIDLHRVTLDWGESGSNPPNQEGQGAFAWPGDATWLHTFYSTTFWTTPGGDYEPAISASQNVDQNGFYEWTSPGLLADVQYFLDHPDSNFGWILIGNESTFHTTKHFASRTNILAILRPVLKLVYTLPCPILKTGDVNTDGNLTSADIIGLVNFIFKGGAHPQPCDATADVNCSGSATSADIISMVNYVFKGGTAPCDVCTLIPSQWSCP